MRARQRAAAGARCAGGAAAARAVNTHLAGRRRAPVYAWLEERVELQSLSDDVASKRVPPHVNLFYCFGGLAFTGFLFQLLSGAALSLFFRPTVLDCFLGRAAAAFDFAWLLRCSHRASSNLLLLLLALHAGRVFFTGGLARPRELTWATGLALTALTSAFGASGYTLPWDQLGFWAYQVVSSIPASLDGLLGASSGPGHPLARLLRGGPVLGQLALSRCWAAHTLLLPGLLVPALGGHAALVRKQGISGPL